MARNVTVGQRPKTSTMVTIAAAVAMAVASGCSRGDGAAAPAGATMVTVATPDGETLVGTLVGEGPGVVIAHGANANRTHWYAAGAQIAAAGFEVLMIDLRGTGESTGERRTNQDVDILAAVDYLTSRGEPRPVALIGSSMGATSVLVAGGQSEAVAAIVGLSPPAQSFAMDARSAAPRITVPVMLAVATDDTAFVESTRELAELLGIEPVITSGGGHGTGQFADNPELVGQIIEFVRTSITDPTG